LPPYFRSCPEAARMLKGADPDLPCLLRVVAAKAILELDIDTLAVVMDAQIRIASRPDAQETYRAALSFAGSGIVTRQSTLPSSSVADILGSLHDSLLETNLSLVLPALVLDQNEDARSLVERFFQIPDGYATWSLEDQAHYTGMRDDFINRNAPRLAQALGTLGDIEKGRAFITEFEDPMKRSSLLATFAQGLANRGFVRPSERSALARLAHQTILDSKQLFTESLQSGMEKEGFYLDYAIAGSVIELIALNEDFDLASKLLSEIEMGTHLKNRLKSRIALLMVRAGFPDKGVNLMNNVGQNVDGYLNCNCSGGWFRPSVW
ncbi:MAG: hypothetical protein RLN72_08575, partial [Henriciella sp.]